MNNVTLLSEGRRGSGVERLRSEWRSGCCGGGRLKHLASLSRSACCTKECFIPACLHSFLCLLVSSGASALRRIAWLCCSSSSSDFRPRRMSFVVTNQEAQLLLRFAGDVESSFTTTRQDKISTWCFGAGRLESPLLSSERHLPASNHPIPSQPEPSTSPPASTTSNSRTRCTPKPPYPAYLSRRLRHMSSWKGTSTSRPHLSKPKRPEWR